MPKICFVQFYLSYGGDQFFDLPFAVDNNFGVTGQVINSIRGYLFYVIITIFTKFLRKN
jgi:hypothetical protein